jgi:hypothetical protein
MQLATTDLQEVAVAICDIITKIIWGIITNVFFMVLVFLNL